MIKIETITPDLGEGLCRKMTTPELGYVSDGYVTDFERHGYTGSLAASC